MRRLFIISLVLLLCATSFGTPISGNVSDKIGAFSGDGGANQDDSVKASLDLAHTDLDALIAAGIPVSSLIGAGGRGSVYYVDNNATGTADGTSWTNAEVTIEGAVANCTTSYGDVILVSPRHGETLAAGDAVDLDKIGVKVVGVGEGDRRALLSYTAAGEFVLGADGTGVYNIRFLATSDSVVHAIDVEANVDGWEVANCEFQAETTTVDEFDDVITISTATTKGVIRNNTFLGDVGANAEPQSCINFNTAHYLSIIGNEFYGDRAVACIENAAAANFPIIKDNVLFNGIIGGTAGLNTQPCIELHASTSAVILNNSLYCNVATEDLAIVAADGFLDGNTYNESEGSFLKAGQTYTISSSAASVAAAAVQLFAVAGGAIEITSCFGECTVDMAGSPGAVSLLLDATTADYDSDFTTAVNIDALNKGDIITFAAVSGGESVLDPTANVNAGLPLSWFGYIGDIEQFTASTGTGAIIWHMTFRPLVAGVTVTAY